ncbi:GntR family transcriptional regulator [Streptomyces sp. NPDC020412]|uniref:GntR family transcriptional regulator n=1 Tax=Streptomyces sp. NPDC020412 TaxID=3365073 RepID=UPI0037A494CB
MAANRNAYIADELRAQIHSDALAAGAQLPSEATLMRQYQASRPTVREALARLESEGLVMRLHGRGNFVRHRFGTITYSPATSVASLPEAVDAAVTTHLRTTVVTARSARLVAPLAVPPHTEFVQYTYVSQYMVYPLSVTRVYVPCAVAQVDVGGQKLAPFGDDVRQGLIDAGVRIAQTTTQATSRLPTADEVMTLRIGAGTAVLGIERVSRDDTGQVVEAAFLTLPGHSARIVHPPAVAVLTVENAPAAQEEDSAPSPWEGADSLGQSALEWPACECGQPVCPDKPASGDGPDKEPSP